MNKKVIFTVVSFALVVGIIFLILNNQKETLATGSELSQYLISLSKVNGSGVKKYSYSTYSDYRYEGAEPNNYVKFNNDMYRIIGAFNKNSHGVTDKNGNDVLLVKLIRSRILGSYCYSCNISKNYEYAGYSNYFVEGTALWKLLNEYFYYDEDVAGENCGKLTFYTTSYYSNDCSDLLGYAIKDSDSKSYIQKTKWFLYPAPASYNGTKASTFYSCERGKDTSCVNGSARTKELYETEANIGLMYLSDYMYASSSSPKNDNRWVYNGYDNWLFQGHEWTLLPFAGDANQAFFIRDNGGANVNVSNSGYGVRPTFYLKSSVYVKDGDGSFDNPYILGCDDCGV